VTPHPEPAATDASRFTPRLIAWEVTRSCPLACKHCRAAARSEPYAGELTTDECFAVLDNIAAFCSPIIILTGGEPMLREDIYDIAAHATGVGLRTVMAPCGALLDDESVARILAAGIDTISISLDGATAAVHDAFRGVAGSFDDALRGLDAARRGGLGFQINTTVTQHNLDDLPRILELAVELGASVFNPFLLVPTGRGSDLADQEISPEQYEQTLRWLAARQGRDDIAIRVTCAPHYQRIVRQMNGDNGPGQGGGCMGGKQFAFISHLGRVQICGFLDLAAGDLRTEGLDFGRIWETSDLFGRMRDPDAYHGRCGYCEFAPVCGGCRARTFALTGDEMAEEPFCLHQPARRPKVHRDELDNRLLSIIQTDFPITERPFDELAGRLDSESGEIIKRINRLCQAGTIRRLGSVFDSASLGYTSTLVAARIPAGRIDEVAAAVSELPGVTNNYRREHEYNLWFTLTAESPQRQGEILADLARRTGIDEFHSLPALAVYKIRAEFQPAGGSGSDEVAPNSPAPRQAVQCTEQQKQLVRLLQESLPLIERPYAALAGRLDLTGDEVLQQIRRWRDAGVIRRFGALVNHRHLGFGGNGMAVFRVAENRIDRIGKELARRRQVSHCYQRRPLESFDYNLFAMVHGTSAEQVTDVVAEIVAEIGPCEHAVLFSTTEYKKTSMKYFV